MILVFITLIILRFHMFHMAPPLTTHLSPLTTNPSGYWLTASIHPTIATRAAFQLMAISFEA